MKRINIRVKGASGEREVAQLFANCMAQVEARLGGNNSEFVKRCSSSQADRGGSDLVGIPGLGVEVKRGEKLQVDLWWKQCCEQAIKQDLIPVLFYRKNRLKWRVVMYMLTPEPMQWIPADITARKFFEWYALFYEKWLDNGWRSN